MRVLARLLPFVLLVTLALPAAAEAACETTWNGSTGLWSDANKWSNGVPSGDKGACVPSGDVTIDFAAEAEAIDIGGGSGDQALVRVAGGTTVDGAPYNGGLRLYTGGTIHPDGVLSAVAGGGSNPGDTVLSTDIPHPLVNNGVLRTAPGGNGLVHVRVRLLNAGTVDLNESAEAQLDWTNTGTIDIAAGESLLYTGTGAGPTFRHEGGTIAVNGTFVQTNGRFVHVGPATVTGVVQFVNTQLNASGPGDATYALIGVPGVGNGSDLAGDISAGKTVVVRNNSQAAYGVYVRPDPIVNRGTLVFDGSGQIDIGLYQGIENRGLIRVLGTGFRQVTHPLVNAAGGTLELARALQVNTTFVQQPGATLDVGVNGSSASLLTVRDAATLGGTLRVTTAGPPTGSPRIVQAGSRTGTFAATQFVGPEWTVAYDATGALLRQDTAGPATSLSGKKRQQLGKSVAVTVGCDEACTVAATGNLNVANASKAYRLKKVTRSVAAEGTANLKLKISKKARRAARKALRNGRKVRAKLTVIAEDAAGNRTTKRRTVRLAL